LNILGESHPRREKIEEEREEAKGTFVGSRDSVVEEEEEEDLAPKFVGDTDGNILSSPKIVSCSNLIVIDFRENVSL
jgi:hypothetical protein